MDAPNQWHPRRRHEGGRIFFGFIIALIGLVFLLHSIFPGFWHFSHLSFGWPWILVIIGLAIGIKTGFRRHAWWILMLIGGAHIVIPSLFPDIPVRRVVWPTLLIGFGLAIIFGKNDRKRCRDGMHMPTLTNDNDTVSIDLSFSGRKEIVTSKTFRGGFIKASFAGVELNLVGADSSGSEPMVLDMNVSFGSVELVIPSHWDVQNEIRPFAGSVEDERVIRTAEAGSERRLLILRGSVNFGSLELKSY